MCRSIFIPNQIKVKSQKLYLGIFSCLLAFQLFTLYRSSHLLLTNHFVVNVRLIHQQAAFRLGYNQDMFNKILRKSYSKSINPSIQKEEVASKSHVHISFTISVLTVFWEFLCYTLNVTWDKICLDLKCFKLPDS